MSKTRFLFVVVGMVAACATDNSGLYDLEPIGHTYYADCDRNLEVVERTEGGDLKWSLSQVGCLRYDDGFLEKPQFLPVKDTKFLFFSDGLGDDFQECSTTTKGLSVYADCPRESGPLYVGKLNSVGRVKLSQSLAFNVVIKEADGYRRFDHEVDSDETYVDDGRIGFALRSSN